MEEGVNAVFDGGVGGAIRESNFIDIFFEGGGDKIDFFLIREFFVIFAEFIFSFMEEEVKAGANFGVGDIIRKGDIEGGRSDIIRGFSKLMDDRNEGHYIINIYYSFNLKISKFLNFLLYKVLR